MYFVKELQNGCFTSIAIFFFFFYYGTVFQKRVQVSSRKQVSNRRHRNAGDNSGIHEPMGSRPRSQSLASWREFWCLLQIENPVIVFHKGSIQAALLIDETIPLCFHRSDKDRRVGMEKL